MRKTAEVCIQRRESKKERRLNIEFNIRIGHLSTYPYLPASFATINVSYLLTECRSIQKTSATESTQALKRENQAYSRDEVRNLTDDGVFLSRVYRIGTYTSSHRMSCTVHTYKNKYTRTHILTTSKNNADFFSSLIISPTKQNETDWGVSPSHGKAFKALESHN